MTPDTSDPDLHEIRPAPGILLRHRGAELDIHQVARGGPRVDLHRGALWVRAVDDGPGVTVTHGAASIQLRSGAVVVEVHDVEALLLVASGHAAVTGASQLPRSVAAGQAVALTIDGTASEPDHLAARELAADRMVVENLARDMLASRRPAPATMPGELGAPGADPVDATPRLRARPELVLRSEVVAVRSEPSALEAALANVGVTDAGATGSPVRPAGPGPLGAIIDGPHPLPELDEPPPSPDTDTDTDTDAIADDDATAADLEGGPEAEAGTDSHAGRRRKIIALVVVAMVLLAIVAAVVLTASS